MEYLAILIFILLLFSYLKHSLGILLFNSKKKALMFFASCLFVGILWDSFGVLRGHWSLGEKYLVGIKIGVLSIEEYMFIIIIPYSVAVLYKIMKSDRLKNKPKLTT